MYTNWTFCASRFGYFVLKQIRSQKILSFAHWHTLSLAHILFAQMQKSSTHTPSLSFDLATHNVESVPVG